MVSDRVTLLQMQDWNSALVAPAADSSIGIKASKVVLYSAAVIGVLIVLAAGWLFQKPRHTESSRGPAE
jgi:hypothetical protein